METLKKNIINTIQNDNLEQFKEFVDNLKSIAEDKYKLNTRLVLYSFMRTRTKERFGGNSPQYEYLKKIAMTADERKGQEVKNNENVRESNTNVIKFNQDDLNKLMSDIMYHEDLYSKILFCQLVSGARTIEILSNKYKFSPSDKVSYIKQETAKQTVSVDKPLIILDSYANFMKYLKEVRSQVDQTKTNNEMNQKYASSLKYRIRQINNPLLKKSHNARSIYVAVSHKKHAPNTTLAQHVINVLGHTGSDSVRNYSGYVFNNVRVVG